LADAAHGEPLSADARKELLAKAAAWQVPQPTSEAKLVKIGAYASDEKMFALGFIEAGDAQRALVGANYWDISDDTEVSEVVDLAELKLESITPSSPFDPAIEVNFGLITGIQFLRRGEDKLGLALIEKALAEDAGDPHSLFYAPAGEPPTLMLARACLSSAMNEIPSPRPDFARIKSRIERLLTDEPQLNNETTKAVLRALKENVAHETAPAGSLARLVDDYVIGGGTSGGIWGNMHAFTPAERVLILKGLEAVPALLAARHSHRFSNHLMQGFNNFPSFPMTAGQVIDAYLRRLANQELKSDWLDRQRGSVLDDQVLADWWKEASALGEEAYVKKYTIVVDEKNNASISYELLLIAVVRYPALLGDFYRRLLTTSQQSWPVADAIVDCDKISREEKVELFEAGMATNNEFHRFNALRSLFRVNPSLADGQLVRILTLLTDSSEKKSPSNQDAPIGLSNLGFLVSMSRDAATWDALLALLGRCSINRKFDLVDHLYPPPDAPANVLRTFQSIYSKFADDESIGLYHDRSIAMRDFIHAHWADWLDLDRELPDQDATPDDWAKYRAAVREAIEKHANEPAKP